MNLLHNAQTAILIGAGIVLTVFAFVIATDTFPTATRSFHNSLLSTTAR